MKHQAAPFPFLVSFIFFRLPALLGTVKDFVTTGWRLAAGFRGCKDFLGYNDVIKSNANYSLRSLTDFKQFERAKKAAKPRK